MNRIALCLLLTLPMLAVAQENPDAVFYRKAAQLGIAEVDSGMLAQQQGGAPGVKNFGAMMVKDHSAANNRLRDIAVQKSVDLPVAASPEQMSKKASLQGLSGNDFDRAYIEWQILSHKDAIALFKEESASGDDVDAKQFAGDTLPTLQSHLKMLYTIQIAMPAPPAPPAPPAAPGVQITPATPTAPVPSAAAP